MGRRLLPGEIVHHIDLNPGNNDPENLEVMTASAHGALHSRARRLAQLRFQWQLDAEGAGPADIYWSMLADLDLSEIC